MTLVEAGSEARHNLARSAVAALRRLYPQADCTLTFAKPWHLLVAAILSAQCTDDRVNQVTPALFARYGSLRELASADPAELAGLIRSCGLYHSKTRAILGTSQKLVEQHGGQLPDTLAALTRLPGVGRKIANLILGDVFHQPAIVVDTHCARISRLIGLTDYVDPPRIERDLMQVLPQADWIAYGHLCVSHGRALCPARRPRCDRCPLAGFCRYACTGCQLPDLS
jgi:endonuclease-3